VGDYALTAAGAYETPLGLVRLDQEFIADLEEGVSISRVGDEREHSLEIQLPFLQRQLGDFRLVPILMSAHDPAQARALAAALAPLVRARSEQGQRVLLVASSDLHHIEDYELVVRRDKGVVDALAAFDLEALTRLLMDRDSTVCGRMPILTALHAARELGADAVKVLHHTTSGDVTGQHGPGHYTVGYAAAAVLDSSAGLDGRLT
jgi:AmmeMemoRadiSam system protein B